VSKIDGCATSSFDEHSDALKRYGFYAVCRRAEGKSWNKLNLDGKRLMEGKGFVLMWLFTVLRVYTT
jgi:hypothetical protein